MDQDGPIEERLHDACYSALDNVQDFVAETTAEPWPAPVHELPEPSVVVSEQQIALSYGAELLLPPIPRSEL